MYYLWWSNSKFINTYLANDICVDDIISQVWLNKHNSSQVASSTIQVLIRYTSVFNDDTVHLFQPEDVKVKKKQKNSLVQKKNIWERQTATQQAGIVNFFVNHTHTQFTEESKMATALTERDWDIWKKTWHDFLKTVTQNNGAGTVQLAEHVTEKPRHITDAGSTSSPQFSKAKGFFLSQGQLSVQTLLQCLHSPLVQQHASTSVCTLK